MKFVRVQMNSSALALIALLAGALLPVTVKGEDGPIDKVVTLLQTLKDDLDKDEKTEQSVYDKYACWCEETTGRKAQNIEDAKSEMKRLGQEILKQKGTVAVRTDEIEEKQEQIKENEDAQAKATSSRSKENSDWQRDSAETSQAMSAINEAMGVLMKATSFLESDSTARLQAAVSAVINAAPTKSIAALSPANLADLRSFAQVHHKMGYAPQSATIQGILGDMYKTMGIDVQDSTATEAQQNRAFENYIHEKEEELANLNKILTRKQKEKTEAEAMMTEATETYDDVSNQLEADVKFFDVTKKACQEKTDEWKVRSDLRTDEIDGISKALELLTSDDAKKLFKDAIKPGQETFFLQIKSKPNQMKQADLEKLYGKLKERATKSHSLRLAALAAQVRMAKAGHFDKVIKAIDELIGVLAEEQDTDTKKRNLCEEDYQDIAQESAKLKWKIENHAAQIQKLENIIEEREGEKAETIKQIESTESDIQKMKDDRKDENDAFKVAKKDDVDAIKLLKQAKVVLMEFYSKNDVKMGDVQGSVKLAATVDDKALKSLKLSHEKPQGKDVRLQHNKKAVAKAGVSLLQEAADPMEDPDKAPDATFSNKGKRKNQSKGIVSIMTMVIEDLEAEVRNGIKSEEGAQMAFEEALADANTLLKDLNGKKVSLEKAIAKGKEDKITEEEDKEAREGDLDAQDTKKADMKEDCDYMIAKHDERRDYRTAETEALVDAKEFLANYFDSADEGSFVQSKGSFPHISYSHLASPHLRK